MKIDKPVQVTVTQGTERLPKEFYSDLLVYKQTDIPRPHNQILAFSVMGYAFDLKEYIKRYGRISIMHRENPYMGYERFEIPNLEDYDVEEIKAGDKLKYVFTRRVDSIIKLEGTNEENKKDPAYPLLFLSEENKDDQKTEVYNMVKNGVTSPMFPNVEEPQILAGQLFTEKKEAEKILRLIRGESVEAVNLDHLKRTKFLLQAFQGWKEYLFNQMVKERLIRAVNVHFQMGDDQIYEIIIDEEVIENIIKQGVKNRQIIFTEAKRFTSKIEDFNEFMFHHATPMAKRIDSIAKPIHRLGDIRTTTHDSFTWLKRQPLPAQKDAIEASIKALELKGKVNVIGECGVGKTHVMTATNYLYNRLHNQDMKLLIFCPDTLVDTVWQEEIAETLYDCQVHVINSISDILDFDEKGYLDDNVHRAFILSQRVAKSGYELKPSAVWSKAQQAFRCPCCGERVTKMEKTDTKDPTKPKYVEVNVGMDWFKTLRKNSNYKCKKCEAVLWEPYNREATNYASFITGKKKVKKTGYVYSKSPKGFFPRDTKPVKALLAKLVDASGKATDSKARQAINKEIEQYRTLQMIMEGTEPEAKKVSPRKVSVAEFIFKKMKNRFTNLIIDEFHEFQGNSARADACVQLINAVPLIQTGTGTGMNGYAKSRFKTDYMLYPEKMKKAGFTIDDEDKYQSTFGVVERRWRLRRHDGKDKKDTLAPIPKPGISPVIFPLFMQDTTVFLSLTDLKENLPELKHSQIEVEMDPELEAAKSKLEAEIKAIARHDKKLFQGSMRVGYSFLDMPTVEKELKDSFSGDVVLKTPVISSHSDNKLMELLRLAKEEVQREDRRMMVYTNFTGDGINDYLNQHLRDAGYRVTVLNKQGDFSLSCDGESIKVDKENREKFIREEVKKGTEIMIVNPELIKTGYNLMDFPTICYYQMSYQVYTNRQADRRAWRLGQTKTCKIVYIYYKDSIQQNIASLMATKIVASQAIEGNMDAAGLEAIVADRTAEEELAKKFFEGIRGRVGLASYNKDKSA